MVEVGKKYKTVGGWPALVIYISETNGYFYAIHEPNTLQESTAITHKLSGMAVSFFAIGEPPRFNHTLPADILINEEIQ